MVKKKTLEEKARRARENRFNNNNDDNINDHLVTLSWKKSSFFLTRQPSLLIDTTFTVSTLPNHLTLIISFLIAHLLKNQSITQGSSP